MHDVKTLIFDRQVSEIAAIVRTELLVAVEPHNLHFVGVAEERHVHASPKLCQLHQRGLFRLRLRQPSRPFRVARVLRHILG